MLKKKHLTAHMKSSAVTEFKELGKVLRNKFNQEMGAGGVTKVQK